MTATETTSGIPGVIPQSEGQHRPSWQDKLAHFYDRVTYTPKRCRYDPEKPFGFSMSLNILFAFAATFTVANLYYNHPILNKLARDFNVTDEQASYVPTLSQAGYAGGLLLLCPMGDLVKRRAMTLTLVFFSATMWLILCLTTNFSVFCGISFVVCFTTVTPQIMLPLVGDLAPPHRRATALSVVGSGLILGILVARLLSGIVSNWVSWRYIYWIAFGLQYIIWIMLYLFMPDYPSTNPDINFVKKYPTLLVDIVKIVCKHPIILQACLIGFFTSGTFTSYWTTLTFLLAGSPYYYDSLKIGLFALIGVVTIVWGPFFARVILDKHVPFLGVLVGQILLLIGIIIGTCTGKLNAAGPAIQGILLDMGIQVSQLGNRTGIYAVEPKARNRVNTAYMISVFCGQLMGTAAGNHLYAQGGWIRSDVASIGFAAAALVLALVRGPHAGSHWIGWYGGWSMKKRPTEEEQMTPPMDEEMGESINIDAEPQFESGNESKTAHVSQGVKVDQASESEKTLAAENTPIGRRSLDSQQKTGIEEKALEI